MIVCHVAWCDIAEAHDHHGYPECAGKSCDPRRPHEKTEPKSPAEHL